MLVNHVIHVFVVLNCASQAIVLQDGAYEKIKSLVALAAFAGTFSLPAFAQTADGDGDGVADSVDVFPCESRWASMQAVPGENAYSTLLVEDQWPSQGDYDFNDAVLDYNVELYKNAAGLVDEIRYGESARWAQL